MPFTYMHVDDDLQQFSLTLEVHLSWDRSSFRLTIVYGSVEDADKQSFLTELASIKPSRLTMLIVMCDFNLIYQAHNKNNLNLNRGLMGQFR
jgi:hypothetical protein